MGWNETFTTWAQAPSETEQQKCDNAVEAVHKAVASSPALSDRDINVFPQGSYRNRTNVRLESDVDVCVLCEDVCLVDYSMSEGLTDADVGLRDHPYTYGEFKNDLESALRNYFGDAAVYRGNKAFDVNENGYRVDADVVPCFEYRRYHRRSSGGHYFHSGTAFIPDSGGRIVNWPQQNYDSGVKKNDDTNRSFKPLVRILKRLRYKMEDEGIVAAKSIPSYLIECLVWNVPTEGFTHSTHLDDLRYALAHSYHQTKEDDPCREWGEINELKYLFRPSQPWTRVAANDFIVAAWNYVGFK